ncbi:MAG: sulfotransferase [Colwellia sp.]
MKVNLFLVGTPKAATTSIHDFLSCHPDVSMSKVKEPHYFSEIGGNVPSVKGLKSQSRYEALFSETGKRYYGESSVSYMHSFDALNKIKLSTDSPKIVIMLRDPVKRMFSHWLMDVRDGVQSLDFKAAIQSDYLSLKKGFGISHMYVECSHYSESIEECYRLFGRENVYVGFFEDYVNDSERFNKKLLEWLGLSLTEMPGEIPKSNPASVPRNYLMTLLFHNYFLRSVLKYMLPDILISKIRSIVLKPANKVSISKVDYMEMGSYFETDLEKLSEIIDWDLSRWHWK